MTRISILAVSALIAIATHQVVTAIPGKMSITTELDGNIPSKYLSNGDRLATRQNTPPPDSPPPDLPLSWEDETWQNAQCRGAKLLAAMTASEEKQRNILQWPYIQSPWDGDLHQELETWGYKDNAQLHKNADIFCDFSGTFHELGTGFNAMGIDPKSAEFGGPNTCFHVEHQNGPAVKKRKEDGTMPEPKDQRYHVGDREYRVTGAYSKIGINAKDGVIYFLQRKSPDKAAQDLWQVVEPADADLPKLRASSDIAWGLWNRKAAANLENLKMIMAMTITNDETQEVIVPRALKAVDEDLDEVQEWPGTDFDPRNPAHGEAAQALIGSPNGLGAAYLLLQHKMQLGGAKTIVKVKIWRSEDEDHEEPNIIFYVGDVAPEKSVGGSEDALDGAMEEGNGRKIVHSKDVIRSADGENVVREHVFRAKL